MGCIDSTQIPILIHRASSSDVNTCLYSHMNTIVHQATDKVSRRPIMSNTCSTGLAIMLTSEVVEYLGDKAEFEKKVRHRLLQESQHNRLSNVLKVTGVIQRFLYHKQRTVRDVLCSISSHDTISCA